MSYENLRVQLEKNRKSKCKNDTKYFLIFRKKVHSISKKINKTIIMIMVTITLLTSLLAKWEKFIDKANDSYEKTLLFFKRRK
jgi:cell division protein FtsL